MDPKHRVTIPARWRRADVGGPADEYFLLPSQENDYLQGFPPAEFEAVARRVNDNPTVSPRDKQIFIRRFYAKAQHCPLDRQGRLLVPDELRQIAGLEDDLLLVGARRSAAARPPRRPARRRSGKRRRPRPAGRLSRLPVASATTTGRPLAIASTVTQPNVSDALGNRNTSALAKAVANSSPSSRPANTACGTSCSNPSRAGPSPTTSVPEPPAGVPQGVDRRRELAESFFPHQPADEQHHRQVVGEAACPPPFQVPPAGVEPPQIDAERGVPQWHRHALGPQHVAHARGRHVHLVAAVVELPHGPPAERLDGPQPVEAEVAGEVGVERRDDRDAAEPRPPQGGEPPTRPAYTNAPPSARTPAAPASPPA